MTNTTLDFLHRSYIAVVESPETLNIIDLLKGLIKKLSEYDPPEKDSEEFDIFLRNIERSLQIRQKTFALTNMSSDIVFTMMYIAIWVNKIHGLNIDINIIARRKALESELAKLLEKDEIHDRFGIRAIVLNNDSDDDSIEIEKLYTFSKYVLNILTTRNRKDSAQFRKWIDENQSIDTYTKKRIKYILNIPFQVNNRKDYINTPKPNGYQSLHYVLQVEMYSKVLPGAEFEIQIRTYEMHQHAVNGKSNHDVYKQSREDVIKNTFKIDNFESCNLIGFRSYQSSDDDIDGIHQAKILFNRRISNSLVQ